MRLATIDIGSNSMLLTIVETHKSGYTILHDEAHVTGLAKGLDASGCIRLDRKEKSIQVAKLFSQVIQKFKVDKVVAVTTEALRRAKDGDAVRLLLEKNLEYPIELISGEREAELSFWSVQHEYPKKELTKVVFDIGGASTEVCEGSDKGILRRVSLKVGSVLLTEKFGLDKISSNQMAHQYVKELLLRSPFSDMTTLNVGIGVAGTMTTLAAIHKKLDSYDRNKVHQLEISKPIVDQTVTQLLSMNANERANVPGLTADRADVIGGGIVIIQALMDYFEWPSVTCMDCGVRFGLIHEAIRS